MGAVEILKAALDRQSSAEQSLSFLKPNVAVLSHQSGVLSHKNGQGGCDSMASTCASAIFCGTVALLSASTAVLMMEQLNKGGRTKRVWSQYFVKWSKGGRVRPRSSYDVRHQTLQCTFQISYRAVLSQVMRGFEYCKELMSK